MAVAFDRPPAEPASSPRKSGVRKIAGKPAVAEPPLSPEPPPAVPDAPDAPAAAPPEPALAAQRGPEAEPEPEPELAPGPEPAHAATPATVLAFPPTAPARAPSWPEPDPGPAIVVEAEVPAWRSTRAVAALAAVAVAQLLLIGWLLSRPSEGLGGDGELVVQSRPEGAKVLIDDQERGVTPLTLRISPGTHVLQLRAGAAEPRIIPLQVRPGVQTAQYVELMGVATTGVLDVRSEPAKAKVTVDGQERGSTPLVLRDLEPRDYQVVLERGGWKSTQVVRVEPGGTSQLVVPIR